MKKLKRTTEITKRRIRMSERLYLSMVEEGISYYKRCLDASTSKNKARLAKKSLEALNRALVEAKKLDFNEKAAYLYEYITHINMIIAVEYLEINKLDKSVEFLNSALSYNKRSPKNDVQKERTAIIYSQLALIAHRIKQHEKAISLGSQALDAAKKTEEKLHLDLLIKLNPVFIDGLDVKQVKSNYKRMVKLVEKLDNEQLRPKIYYEYAKFLFEVDKKYKKAKKYLKKAKSHYNKTGEINAVKFLTQWENEHFSEDGKPISD